MGLMLCEWNMTVLCICCVFFISVNNVASDFILSYFILSLLQPERLASTDRRKGLYIVKLNNNFPRSWIELMLKVECAVNLHKLAE